MNRQNNTRDWGLATRARCQVAPVEDRRRRRSQALGYGDPCAVSGRASHGRRSIAIILPSSAAARRAGVWRPAHGVSADQACRAGVQRTPVFVAYPDQEYRRGARLDPDIATR
jgi:hypothetical protein